MVYVAYRNRVEERNSARENEQRQRAYYATQGHIADANIRNMNLQNEALAASIEAMSGRRPGIAMSTGNLNPPLAAPYSSPDWGGGASASGGGSGVASGGGNSNFPSLAEIQAMITSSQAKAQEDFDGKINLLRTQEQEKQEEEQTSARNAASRTLSYQRGAAGQAWESALRGR